MSQLCLEKLCFSYFNGMVLQDVNLSVEKGEMVGLVGPNGCGKTTLLRLASGVLNPVRGEVRLDETRLSRLKRRMVAQKVAVVPQYFYVPFAFTVAEVVTLGRIPFLRLFAEESRGDREAVRKAMQLTGVEALVRRTFNELSGGERQRVILAMALAQEPQLLLLDEPTAHLDISHQLDMLQTVKRLNQEKGLTVIAAMHDLNLAALFFHRLVVLKEGRLFAQGSPAEVLTQEIISNVFSTEVVVERHPLADLPHVVVVPPADRCQP